MGFIRGALFGIAVCTIVQHITKKDELTGRSILDDFFDTAPDYIDKAKELVQEVKSEFRSAESTV